jgi:hypothetical protein
MKNLAGNDVADHEIRRELTRTGIPILELTERSKGEVPFSIIGQLGRFTFERAWVYWMVEGEVPLDVARIIYEDPVGRTDIRADGHAGRLDPVEVAHQTGTGLVVARYHIDTELGLDRFRGILIKNNLAPDPGAVLIASTKN